MDSNNDGIGDLRGVIDKLDYIKSLHVDIIWLSPIFSSPNDDNGYDVSDYCAIMAEFGTMEDFDELLSKVHDRGMKLILDLVANHCSDEHRWFEEAKKSKDNRYRDYFHWLPPALDGGPPNNWKSFFGGSAWELDPTSGEYYLHLFTKKQPDLNWENPKVREEIYNAMRFWLDKGVDGFRMDVVPLISKRKGYPAAPQVGFRKIIEDVYANGPRVHEYLQEMKDKVMKHYEAFSLAEGVGIDTSNASLYVNDDREELDMLYHFDLLECTIVNGKFEVKTPFDLVNLKRVFKRWRDATDQKGWLANAIGNHDFARAVSRFGNDKEYWSPSAKMLIIMLATQNGTLNIYQGDEIGMTNLILETIDEVRDVQSLNFYNENRIHKRFDPEEALKLINEEGRDNARTPMQWNNGVNAGFSENKETWITVNPNYQKINVRDQDKDPNSILNFYRMLLDVRKKHEVFVFGEVEELNFEHPKVYGYTKRNNEEAILVLLNFSQEDIRWVSPSNLRLNKVIINNYEQLEIKDKEINLKPYQGTIVQIA